MSIVVTCACAMTYRLPDRYAGKRCRCRECGKRIQVPADEQAGETKARKAKAKRTTRRLASHEQEIMSEHRTLRAGKSRPVSESMHQLSPIDMSRALEAPEALAPRKAKRARPEPEKRSRKQQKTKSRSRSDEREAREDRARDRRERDRDRRDDDSRQERVEQPRKKNKKGSAKARKRERESDDHEGEKQGKRGKAAKGKKGSRLDLEAKGGKRATGARPGVRSGARARRDVEDEEREVGKRRDPVMAAVAIAAVLCLAVGLIIGVALQGGGGGGEELQQKLTKANEEVVALKGKREWESAKAALQALLPELDQAGMAAEASKAREEMRLLDALGKLSAIEDEDERLETLLQYARDKDVAIRLGVTHELRSLSDSPEAQEALATLAKDTDDRVAETARQGLIAAGGVHSIPYLAQAIADSAATGNKQGQIALERAMEIDDPRVVTVLIKAIEVRSTAPKGVLLPILQKLHDLGDPAAKAALKKLTSHADAAVAEKAQKVLEDLGG